MLFDRIRIHNFQRYAGDFEILFPDPEKNTSLIVVLAPNNTGKTTIIRALKFLLYGDLGTKTSTNAWELVNERIRESAQEGEDLKAFVEARIRISGQEPITIKRSITIRKFGEKKWVVEGPMLHYKKSDNAGERFMRDDGLIQGKLVRAVPEELFSWFYFHGEPAGGKMAHGGTDGLRSSLQRVIQLQRWEESHSLAKKLVTKIQQEIAGEMGVNSEFNRIQSQLNIVQKGLDDTKTALTKCADLLEEGATKMEELDVRIDIRAKTATESETLLKQIRDLERRKSEHINAAERSARDYRDLVSKAGALPFLKSTFDLVDHRLEGLRKRNLLPADVSKGFIERLLSQKNCVCGRPHDNDAVKHLSEYLTSTLATQTNSDLLTLSNRLDPKSGSLYRKKIDGLPNDLLRLQEAEQSERRKASDVAKDLDQLQPPDQRKLDDFQSLLRERRILSAKIDNIKDKQREYLDTRSNQEKAIKRLKDELRSIAPKNRSGKVTELQEELKKAEKLLAALEIGRDRFQTSVATILRSHLSELFDNAVTSGNRSTIHSRTFLPAIQTPSGQIERDPGGGEKQVLELAYVIALAQLRREINDTVREAGIGGTLLGPQSFILDSPFTSVDPNYMRVIAEFLPKKAHQMMILVAKQNWHETIRKALEDHVTAVYAITLHTSSEIKEPDAYRFEFKEHKLDLLKRLPGREPAFTTVKKI
jgi:DNA sulfur modification protein DndD